MAITSYNLDGITCWGARGLVCAGVTPHFTSSFGLRFRGQTHSAGPPDPRTFVPPIAFCLGSKSIPRRSSEGRLVIPLGLFVHCLYRRAMRFLGIAPGGQSCEKGDPAAAPRTASCATFAIGKVIPVTSLPLALRYTCAAIVPCGGRCRLVPAVPAVAPRGLERVLSLGQGADSVRVPNEVLVA